MHIGLLIHKGRTWNIVYKQRSGEGCSLYKFWKMFQQHGTYILRKLPYESRLDRLGLTTLERSRIRGDLIETYKKVFIGKQKVDMEQFFELSNTGHNLRGHNKKLAVNRCRLDTRNISLATESAIGTTLRRKLLSTPSRLTSSRIDWTSTGKMWAFKE